MLHVVPAAIPEVTDDDGTQVRTEDLQQREFTGNRSLEEPVTWYGPIVMNTQAELRWALSDLSDGTFIK